MAGPEIKQIQEAADAFKDDKINQGEAKKIAEVLDPAKIKPTDIQEFVKDSKTYPTFLDGIINNIENYTNTNHQNNTFNTLTQTPGEKKLQIEENKIPMQNLSKEQREQMINDARKFLLLLQNEKYKLKADPNNIQNQPNSDAEVPYNPNNPVQSILDTINKNLKNAGLEDRKITQSAESIRDNFRKKEILGQIKAELTDQLHINEKKLNNGDDNDREIFYKNLMERFETQLTDKRLNNLVIGGMVVTINGIKQKMDKPDKNTTDFNVIGINILSNIKDINSLLSANGNIMENLFKNSQDKIAQRIKDKFPKDKIKSMSNKELKNYLNDTKSNGFLVAQGTDTDVVADIFKDTITIDTEMAAINFIESNNGLPKSTEADVGKDGAEIQTKLTAKIKEILAEVPTTPHEKEAFKTELIQNRFSGWPKGILESVFTFAKGLAEKFGLTKLFDDFNKDGLFDKLLLSKSRNDALIAKKLYIDAPGKVGSGLSVTDVPADLNTITGKVDTDSMLKTLNDCKKFISPVTSAGGKETDDKSRSERFMNTSGEYDKIKVENEFTIYVKALGKDRKTEIKRPIEKDKVKTEKIYSYQELIKNDADLVEHFMQYVQTGQMPNGYTDKNIYENMKDLGISPEEFAKRHTNTQPETTQPNPPVGAETPIIEKPREKAANDFATSVQGKAEVSTKWTESYFVKHPKTGIITMFKSPNAKRI